MPGADGDAYHRDEGVGAVAGGVGETGRERVELLSPTRDLAAFQSCDSGSPRCAWRDPSTSLRAGLRRRPSPHNLFLTQSLICSGTLTRQDRLDAGALGDVGFQLAERQIAGPAVGSQLPFAVTLAGAHPQVFAPFFTALTDGTGNQGLAASRLVS